MADATDHLALQIDSMTLSDWGHLALDALGFIPVLGGVFDLINAGWYGIEAAYGVEGAAENAVLSLASAAPLIGDATAGVAKAAKRGLSVAKSVQTAARAIDRAVNLGQSGYNVSAGLQSGNVVQAGLGLVGGALNARAGKGAAAPRNAAEAFAEGLFVRRGVDIGIHRQPRHHIFAQEHRAFFAERGLKDIDKYTLALDSATHDAIHKWMGAGPWNDVMKSRVITEEARLGRLLNKRELLSIGAKMRREAGLSHVKIVPYQD